MKKLLISGKMLVIANLLAINVHGMQKQTAEDEEVSQLSQSLAASASFSDESTDRVMPVSTSSVATMTDPFIPAPMVRVYFSPGLKEYFCELLNHEKSGIDMAFYRFTLLDVAKQIIPNISVKDNKVLKSETNIYEHWVCIEVLRKDIQNRAAQELSSKKSMKIESNREEFQKIFDQEMDKISQ